MKKYTPYIVGAVGGVLAAAIVPLTGLLSFDASQGQWGITDWYFNVSARQSTTLRSFDTLVPELGNAEAIRRGAGHYEMVCATCHGSPVAAPDQFADDLVPQPPRLMDQLANWRPDARIFWTVKHGIKRSGMPAWPTQMRDDEVWGMVSFLGAMPELSPAQYTELAGITQGGCANCHGENGEGNGATPRLDIQSPAYLAEALRAFRSGTRHSGTMIAAAARLTDAQIADLSDYFGRSVTVDLQPSEGLGADIARRGIPERDIAACDSCHGSGADPAYPRLAGQDADYLHLQLELFNEMGEERGGNLAHLMTGALRLLPNVEKGPLSAEEIEALAEHYGHEQ